MMSDTAALKPTSRAIGYRRVSTAEQAGSGLGLDAQATAIAAVGARLGLPLVSTFRDAGLSGGLPSLTGC